MKNAIIIVLSILVIGLGGYVVFDKFVSNSNVEKNNTKSNNVIDTSKDVQQNNNETVQTNNIINAKRDSLDTDFKYYYQNYLPILVRQLYDYKTLLDLNNYKNEASIKSFLYAFYRMNAGKANLLQSDNNTYYINVSKNELDKITYIVFDKDDIDDYSYSIRDTLGISKLDNENYKITTVGTGDSGYYSLDEADFEFNRESLNITANVYLTNPGTDHEKIGRLKFTFNYNSEKQTYYLANIEEIK